MKIAIASENNNVCPHFGHCEGFEIYEVEGKDVLKKEFVANPGHRPGFLPVFLKDLNVKVIIAGGMGSSAQQLFEENGIKVVIGAEGADDIIIKDYLEGSLSSTKNACSH